jgi:hypothetical protein
MSKPLVLNQVVVGNSLLSNYKEFDDALSNIYPKEDFLVLDESDAKLLVASYIFEDTEMLWKMSSREEIYDILSHNNYKEEVAQIKKVAEVVEALSEAITAGTVHTPPIAAAPATTLKSHIDNLNKWKNGTPGATTPPPTVTPGDETIEYKFDSKDSKSLFLAIIIAVPELLNQLVLDATHVDVIEDETFLKENVIGHFKDEFLDILNDDTKTDAQTMDALAVIVFISFGKTIENMSSIFESIDLKIDDTRTVVISFILEVAGVGIVVNDTVWGDENNVLEGIELQLNGTEILVINDMIFVTKYTTLNQYDKWLPSSFYYKYNIHGKELPASVYKTSKDFWRRVVFDGYTAHQSSKNITKYIMTKLR